MQRASASMAIVLLLVVAPFARGQTVNDTPDASVQARRLFQLNVRHQTTHRNVR